MAAQQGLLFRFCTLGLLLLAHHYGAVSAIKCYSCRHYNVTVLDDSAGISLAMVASLEADNDPICGLPGDEFKEMLESNYTDEADYHKVCLPAKTKCTKSWGIIDFIYPYGDYSAHFSIVYYLRGCETFKRLELPAAAPAADEDDTAKLLPESKADDDVVDSGVDPYKPKDKCFNETYYLHSALDHQFYDYIDVTFKDCQVCYCGGGSLCNTGALWKANRHGVVVIIAVVWRLFTK